MPTVIISAITSLASVVVSGFFSWFIARYTSHLEMCKLNANLDHEDVVSSDTEFAEMASAVSDYTIVPTSQTRLETACHKIAAIRAKETGQLGILLDRLYIAIKDSKSNSSCIDNVLSEIIEEKRKAKG